MRDNENTKIIGENVILVPYEEKHVEKYHTWMSDAELQLLTASEPLTLGQEYEMQQTWRHDEDKCTFLVLDRKMYESSQDEIESLIGDTNLFINQDYFVNDDDEDNKNAENNTENNMSNEIVVAEVEIMIAEKSARGKGFGREALLLMLKYGESSLGVQEYAAKIGYDNVKSQRLFERIQFEEQSKSEVFREITYKRTVTDEWTKWLNSELPKFEIANYQ